MRKGNVDTAGRAGRDLELDGGIDEFKAEADETFTVRKLKVLNRHNISYHASDLSVLLRERDPAAARSPFHGESKTNQRLFY